MKKKSRGVEQGENCGVVMQKWRLLCDEVDNRNEFKRPENVMEVMCMKG